MPSRSNGWLGLDGHSHCRPTALDLDAFDRQTAAGHNTGSGTYDYRRYSACRLLRPAVRPLSSPPRPPRVLVGILRTRLRDVNDTLCGH
jgi:hypothetical protein